MSALLANPVLGIGIVDQNTVVFAAVLAACGLLLIVAGWFGLIPSLSSPTAGNHASKRVVLAAAGSVLAFIFSGWPVLAVAGGAAGWSMPTLRAARKERRQAIERVDAIATWVETVRDNISGSAGLSQALSNSGANAPEPIRVEVRDLVLRLQHESIVPSLRKFAADLAHPTSDMAIGCLILASSRSAGSLSSILAHTAQSARDSATMMRHVEAGRVHSQSQAKMVAGIALSLSMLMLITDSDFVSAYDSFIGQIVLSVVCLMAAGCAIGMYRLGKPVPPERVFQGVEIGPAVTHAPLPEQIEV